jgi:hypothetical protein
VAQRETDRSEREQPDMPVGMRRVVLQGLGLLLVLPMFKWPSTPAAAREGAAPDFSDITTRAAAKRLVREGRLVEISLFPVELGGPDDLQNTSYITPEAAFVRELVIGTLSRFFEEDVIDQLRILPEYKGESIVPSRIGMHSRHSGQEGSFNTTIEVW